eukprot:67383-Rhodomonas_salina.1
MRGRGRGKGVEGQREGHGEGKSVEEGREEGLGRKLEGGDAGRWKVWASLTEEGRRKCGRAGVGRLSDDTPAKYEMTPMGMVMVWPLRLNVNLKVVSDPNPRPTP